MPHGSDQKTPYELIFKRKPDLSHLRPFGTVCYAFIAPETRTKLQDSGLKCRLLGYGDDFETEEIKGYRLLREDDLTIIYSDNVVFDKDLKTERLHDDCYSIEDSNLSDSIFEPFEVDTGSTSSDSFYTADYSEDDAIPTESEYSNPLRQLEGQSWWKNHYLSGC
jgi:hypothetical protein